MKSFGFTEKSDRYKYFLWQVFNSIAEILLYGRLCENEFWEIRSPLSYRFHHVKPLYLGKLRLNLTASPHFTYLSYFSIRFFSFHTA